MDKVFNNVCDVYTGSEENIGGIAKKTWSKTGSYACRITEFTRSAARSQNLTESITTDSRKLYTISSAQISVGSRVEIEGQMYNVSNTHLNRDRQGKVKFLSCIITKHT